MNFAITGVCGFVAPRHLRAIYDTGNRVIAALDPHDSVGLLDSYSTDIAFFTEFERFDRFLEKQRRRGDDHRASMISVCSPNYLHDAHIRLAFRIGADAICEKPLVLNPWNLDALEDLQRETGKRVFTILQLRLHPALQKFKERLSQGPATSKSKVELDYVTARGRWYHHSWKGDVLKSGGLATNIGIHFFDLLIWMFGPVQRVRVTQDESERITGELELERADATWRLSISSSDVPESVRLAGGRTYRSLRVNDEEVEFSDGFNDLHTESYRRILNGQGFGTEDARPSIELVHRIRSKR